MTLTFLLLGWIWGCLLMCLRGTSATDGLRMYSCAILCLILVLIIRFSMKKTFLRLLCIASSCVMAQEADTLGVSSVPTQRYEVGDGVTYVYKKPRLIHLVDKLPRNIGKSASSILTGWGLWGLRWLYCLLTLGLFAKAEI